MTTMDLNTESPLIAEEIIMELVNTPPPSWPNETMYRDHSIIGSPAEVRKRKLLRFLPILNFIDERAGGPDDWHRDHIREQLNELIAAPESTVRNVENLISMMPTLDAVDPAHGIPLGNLQDTKTVYNLFLKNGRIVLVL